MILGQSHGIAFVLVKSVGTAPSLSTPSFYSKFFGVIKWSINMDIFWLLEPIFEVILLTINQKVILGKKVQLESLENFQLVIK